MVKKKPRGYWNNISNLEREVLTFVEKHGTPGVMPTARQLMEAKRSDLESAISNQGGYPLRAKGLKLDYTYTAKPQGYWDDFANVERELLAFIKELGTLGVFPKRDEFKRAGRTDLTNAIRRHGGNQTVAERLGIAYTQKRRGYWDDFPNVQRELLVFIKENGTSGVMPTATELTKAGRSSLAAAIQKHGGQQSVAEKLGLRYSKKQDGFWSDANLKRELFIFIKGYGTPGVMPTNEELKTAGRFDLAKAIQKETDIRQ
jgi:hypothetical protein